MIKKINLKQIFAFIGLIGVLFGAFGAHQLKNTLTPDLLDAWKTATLYLFIHVLVGLFAVQSGASKKTIFCFLFGILIFSGSLYTLVLTKQAYLGMLTPIGGFLFISGWFLLMMGLNPKK